MNNQTKQNLKDVGSIVAVSVIEVSKAYGILLAVFGTIYVGSTLVHKAKNKVKEYKENQPKKAA